MQNDYILLQEKVETFIGYKMQTRRHFDMLAEIVFTYTKNMVSATTLRRFWGYQEKEGGVSQNTLNILSRLVGYADFTDFSNAKGSSDESSSELLGEQNIILSSTLSIGNHIHVTWSPDRKVTIEYIGTETFRVLESQNSKLQKDDTFYCSQFVSGMPLYCNRLLRPGFPTMSYVCGKNGGINVKVKN